MKVGKLRILAYIREKADAAVHRLLRPYVGRLMEEIVERWESDAECEDEDIPDCEHCEHSGHCPYEPQAVYEPPPGYILVRPGPPPPPWSIN